MRHARGGHLTRQGDQRLFNATRLGKPDQTGKLFERLEGRQMFSVAVPAVTGDGLSASYFDTASFTNLRTSHVDPQVNFNWGTGSPDASVGVDTFSVRWTGKVAAAATGTTKFHVRADDGVRLWVDGKLVVDDWSVHPPRERSGSIDLVAGQKYDIKLEYYENYIGSVVKLSWTPPGGTKAVIPQSALFSSAATTVGSDSDPIIDPITTPPPVITTPTTPTVTNFALINADTDSVIPGYASIRDGAVLNFATLPTRNLNVRADVSTPAGVTVGSVRFSLDGVANYHSENTAGYALAGDNGSDYYAWTPALGSHTLAATAYTGADQTGIQGAANTITFDVIDQTTTGDTTPTGFVYTVDPNGQLKTITAAINLAKAGDTILVTAGTYHEQISFPTTGTATAPITLAAQTAGTVTIDGTGFDRVVAFSPGAQYINLSGIIVDHCANPGALQPAAISTNTGWKLTDVTVRNTDGTGLSVYGSNVTLLRVLAENNGRAGISGDNASNVLIKDSITRGNNTAGNDPDWDGGAGKFDNSDQVTIDNLDSYNNVGPGVWFDYNNSNIIIRNSKIHDNKGLAHSYSGSGVRLELDQGPVLIENNTFFGNTGPQVDIQSSRQVTVINNTMTGTYVALKDWPRGSNYTLQDINFSGNTFNNTYIYTEGGTWSTTSAATKRISFNNDTFKMTSGKPLAYWANTFYYKLSDVQTKLGLEASGVLLAA